MLEPPGAPEQLKDLLWIPISSRSKAPRVKFKGGAVQTWEPRQGDGYGVLTGPVRGSDNWVWGLDLDQGDLDGVPGGEGAEELQAYLVEHDLELPETLTIQSKSGGLHYYWILETDKWVKGSAKSTPMGEHIDVRGGRIEGGEIRGTGYLKAPPSDGYRVVNDAPIAVAPDWLYELVAWRPVVRTPRKSVPSSPKKKLSALGAALARGGSDPLSRAKRYVESALSSLDSKMEELWDTEHGWHQVGLEVTASLCGLAENQLLSDLGIFTEEDAWKKMSEWRDDTFEDDPSYYEEHLEPAFLSYLGKANPCSLPPDLEAALLLEPDPVPEEELPEAEGVERFRLGGKRPAEFSWLIDRWAAKGALNIINGEPKTTKSTVAGMLIGEIGGTTAWFSMDGEPEGTTQARLNHYKTSEKPFLVPQSYLSTLPEFLERLGEVAEAVGEEGLIVIDSWSSVVAFLDNSYDSGQVRSLCNEIRNAAGDTTVIVIAHASSRANLGHKAQSVMGSQVLEQVASHMVKLESPIPGSVRAYVPFSRYMQSDATIFAGLLPREKFDDEKPPAIAKYRAIGGTLVCDLDHTGWQRIVKTVCSVPGPDSGELRNLDDWLIHMDLDWDTYSTAVSIGFLAIHEVKNSDRFSLSVTPRARYWWSKLPDSEPQTKEQKLAADDDYDEI